MKRFRSSLLLMLGAGLTFFSCVKQPNDAPPDTSNYDPALPVNITIRDLKALNKPYDINQLGLDDTLQIDTNLTIAGVVIANDQSGNFYKQIIIQDSTGGIALNIDDYRLYANYPVGRKIYVKLKGLILGYNVGTPVLGYSLSEQKAIVGLPGAQIGAHIVKAGIGQPVRDTIVNFDDVRNFNLLADQDLVNRLITIRDVQFADTSKAYAPVDDISRYILKCGSNPYTGNRPPAGLMAVRTSAYANFHTAKLPAGNGSITGIYTIYNTSPQLLIRDTTDVRFTNSRCDTTQPTNNPIISLKDLRNLYQGTGVKLGAYRVTGVVISDPGNGNPAGNNIVIQDGDQGITVYYGTAQNYAVGDSLVIDVAGDSLLLYRGSLELKIVGGSPTVKAATGRSVVPKVLTIAEIISNYSTLEWTLVQIQNATVDGGGTYSGNKTLRDGTGAMTLYTVSTATFAQQLLPTIPKGFTGIISQFNTTKQLQIRNINDVQ